MNAFLVYILNNTPWHCPLKHGCSFKKSLHGTKLTCVFFASIYHTILHDNNLKCRSLQRCNLSHLQTIALEVV